MDPFEHAIKEHLELKERNSMLESEMPLARYRAAHMLANHAMFRSEAEAQEEEAGSENERDDWPLAEPDTDLPEPEGLWVGDPAFDWGD
jgi:hypothetical protein